MEDIYCYSYVEDAPSAELAKQLIAHRNRMRKHKVQFVEGFPSVVGGNMAIKNRCARFLRMARRNIHTFSITDLDTGVCAGELIRDWFGIPVKQPISLPKEVVFRVAVREIESWIIADLAAWAQYIAIPLVNFSTSPDTLPDPKQHLLTAVLLSTKFSQDSTEKSLLTVEVH